VDLAEKLIRSDEGYRERVYLCTAGVPTGGWGHAFHVGSRLPAEIWEAIFRFDMGEAVRGYESLRLDLDPVRRAVVVSMIYQLGLDGFIGFRNLNQVLRISTLRPLRPEEWTAAEGHMLDSKWARKDTPERARRLASILRTGEVPR
jgi:GH24 family phage-related lysozyme (muramidase)